jgi:hypothetical protein
MAGAVLCLLAVIFSPLFGDIFPNDNLIDASSVNISYSMCGVLFLMGFDLALYSKSRLLEKSSALFQSAWQALILGILIFLAWGWVALSYVPQDKLATTSIAPMVVARSVWGHEGRLAMGMAGVFAVFAAVNALFFGVSRFVVALIQGEKPLPNRIPDMDHRGIDRLVPVLLAGAVAAAMAGGWAGEQFLETFIRAGIILWLGYYGIVNLAALRRVLLDNTQGGRHFAIQRWQGIQLYAMLTIILGIAGVFFLETEPILLIYSILGVFTMSSLLAGLLQLHNRIRYGLDPGTPMASNGAAVNNKKANKGD